ncbi:TetR/AcrR family transcriptional regulator [Streptomyces sp. NRRL F-525]|uniref:TetR/AcrR family transcriptional regulator n=1 Tax=Streptomyces sp. NRRL F-525 TaxID=1463861 RepID=UPI00068A644B|nr:TetR/AcrR family transcriptional regulator [Streptomyces sp. NRRL F-525]
MPAQPPERHGLPDRRVLRSRAALESALRDLITERELRQISVADLTKRAGVNRSTFYEHYADVHDLAVAACTSTYDELVAVAPIPHGQLTPDGAPLPNPLPALFTHVATNAALYRALLCDEGSARMINHLLHRITLAARISRGLDADEESAAEDFPHDPVSAFLAGAVLGTIMDWLRRDCPGTPEEIGAAIWPYAVACAEVLAGVGGPGGRAR